MQTHVSTRKVIILIADLFFSRAPSRKSLPLKLPRNIKHHKKHLMIRFYENGDDLIDDSGSKNDGYATTDTVRWSETLTTQIYPKPSTFSSRSCIYFLCICDDFKRSPDHRGFFWKCLGHSDPWRQMWPPNFHPPGRPTMLRTTILRPTMLRNTIPITHVGERQNWSF